MSWLVLGKKKGLLKAIIYIAIYVAVLGFSYRMKQDDSRKSTCQNSSLETGST